MNQDRQNIIQESLRRLAKKEGIAEQEVRDEIALAVSLALKSNDPKVREFWNKIPCEGDSPTIEETIDYIILGLCGNDLNEMR